MKTNTMALIPAFLETLGCDEMPMGTMFTDRQPTDGMSPEPMELPTLEKEMKNQVDWQALFSGFSCVIGKIWLARKKKTLAYFSPDQFGCVGGAYYLGFINPMPETIIQYISSGIPDVMAGERYYDSPANAKKVLKISPNPVSDKWCVFKPIDRFASGETPDLVSFFVRGEVLTGLHRLTTYVTNDPEAVVSPAAAACGSLVGWPLYYLAKGQSKAVIGGMDPSARKFFKPDELTFTVPFSLFTDMLNRFDETFLATNTWAAVKKRKPPQGNR